MILAGEDFQLIDVREKKEHDAYHIGGLHLPLGTIVQQLQQVEKSKPVIFYCKKGIRSQLAIQKLEMKFTFQNLFNLEGGLEKWKKTFPEND